MRITFRSLVIGTWMWTAAMDCCLLALAGLILALGMDTVALAQTAPAASVWYKVATEGDSIAIAAPAKIRYGAGAHWFTSPGTFTGNFTAGNALFGDPLVGTVKELDVLETATPQTVTVDGKPVVVPALQDGTTVGPNGTSASPPPAQGSKPCTSALTMTTNPDGTHTLSGTFACPVTP